MRCRTSRRRSALVLGDSCESCFKATEFSCIELIQHGHVRVDTLSRTAIAAVEQRRCGRYAQPLIIERLDQSLDCRRSMLARKSLQFALALETTAGVSRLALHPCHSGRPAV